MQDVYWDQVDFSVQNVLRFVRILAIYRCIAEIHYLSKKPFYVRNRCWISNA
jgi:hypothetical protein